MSGLNSRPVLFTNGLNGKALLYMQISGLLSPYNIWLLWRRAGFFHKQIFFFRTHVPDNKRK